MVKYDFLTNLVKIRIIFIGTFHYEVIQKRYLMNVSSDLKKTTPLPCPDFERKFGREWDGRWGWEGDLICKPIPSKSDFNDSLYFS